MNMTAQSPVTVVGNRQNVFMPIGSPATTNTTIASVDTIKWKSGPQVTATATVLPPSVHNNHQGGIMQQQSHQLVSLNSLQVVNAAQSNMSSPVHQQVSPQTISEVNNNRIVLRPESLRPGTFNIVPAGQTYVSAGQGAQPPPMSPVQQQQQQPFQLRFQSGPNPPPPPPQQTNTVNIPISHEGVIRISPASQHQQQQQLHNKYVSAVYQNPMISPEHMQQQQHQQQQDQQQQHFQAGTQIVTTNFVPSVVGVEATNDGANNDSNQQVIKPTFKNGLTTPVATHGPNTIYQWHTLVPIISSNPLRAQNIRFPPGNGNEGHGNGSGGGQRANGGNHNGHGMTDLSHQMHGMVSAHSPVSSNAGMTTTVISNNMHQHMLHVQQQQQQLHKMGHPKPPPTPPPEPNHPADADMGMLEEEAIDDDVFETPEAPTQSSKGANVHKSGPRTTNSSVHDEAETPNQSSLTVKRRTQSCSAVPLGSKEPQSPLKVSRGTYLFV